MRSGGPLGGPVPVRLMAFGDVRALGKPTSAAMCDRDETGRSTLAPWRRTAG
jgi:hypothetical protein